LLRSTTKVVLDEEAAKDVDFAEVLQSQRAFQQTYAVWRKLAYPSKEL
ncbi:MAG TPA: C4-dicarboxylate ABC transporter, partial [Gammaproteobacteria bacterium]|nr:C4-dicarboxylate ABC transporter [Gammaproteobacteria bacterium]